MVLSEPPGWMNMAVSPCNYDLGRDELAIILLSITKYAGFRYSTDEYDFVPCYGLRCFRCVEGDRLLQGRTCGPPSMLWSEAES